MRIMTRNCLKRLLLATCLGLWSSSSEVLAEEPRIMGPPQRTLQTQSDRSAFILRGRAQGFSPAQQAQMINRLCKLDVNTNDFRQAISTAPTSVRLAVFKNKAQNQGHEVKTMSRRLYGLFNGKRVKHFKTFFQVTPATYQLYWKVFGDNAVSFAFTDTPWHLHTLLKDQRESHKAWHIEYGTQADDALINPYHVQFAPVVQLTDGEIRRFVNYINAGLDRGLGGRNSVLGFYRRGRTIKDMACTNWATTAPIGELPRWVKRIDQQVTQLARAGAIENAPEISEKGFYAALSDEKSDARRTILLSRVLASPGFKPWGRSHIKRLVKSFSREQKDFPRRPNGLVLRTALAKQLGLHRSQDPAKWAYDLFMSKATPVIAVFTENPIENFDRLEIGLNVMGTIDAHGRLIDNDFSKTFTKKGKSGVIVDHAP